MFQKKPVSALKSNVRKTPNRSPGRFFRCSPENKKTALQKKKQMAECSMAWFESDDVFGFGPED